MLFIVTTSRTSTPRPVTVYGLIKKMCESLVQHTQTYGQGYSLPCTLSSCIISMYLSIPVAPLGALGNRETIVSLQFLNLRQLVGLLGWRISPSQGRYLTQTQNKRRQTSMSWVGFEPTIPVFKQAKTFHAIDRTTTVIGQFMYRVHEMSHSLFH
jgi:hypothetical protein